MLQKIENAEITTVKELKSKYPDNWYCYANIGPLEDWTYSPHDTRKVKVVYLADSKRELIDLSIEKRIPDGHVGGSIDYGNNINHEPGIFIGGEYYE